MGFELGVSLPSDPPLGLVTRRNVPKMKPIIPAASTESNTLCPAVTKMSVTIDQPTRKLRAHRRLLRLGPRPVRARTPYRKKLQNTAGPTAAPASCVREYAMCI